MRLFFVLILLTLGIPAYAESAYQPQLNLINQGHPSQAYAELRPKLLASAGNPDFDTAFGLAALDSGATAEAIAALERVLATQPENLAIRTELARAYEKLGDPATAARELKTVQNQPETPPAIRANISNYTSKLDEALSGGPRTIHGSVNTTLGFDSNINNATNASYLTVPAFAALGPARLQNGSRGQSSAYAGAEATLTVHQPLSISRAVFASVTASQKSPTNTSTYQQTTVGAETGIQFLTPDHGKVTTSLGAQQFWFGGDDYSTTYTATANWQLPLTTATNLTTYGTASHISYAQNAMQAANRFVIGTTLDHRFTTPLTPYTFLGAYTGTENTTESATNYFSYNLIGAQAGIEIFPTANLSLFADATYEIRDYKADYPLFFTARQDNQLDLTTGLSYALTSQLLLRPTLSYRNARSNIGFYDYDRWLASINLRYTF